MSTMAIAIFTAVGCLALLALRYAKANSKQPGRRADTADAIAAVPDSTKD